MTLTIIDDFEPRLQVVVIPAANGELRTDETGWKHYAHHVLLATDTDTLSFTYRAGSGHPEEPTAEEVLASLVVDEDGWWEYERDFVKFWRYYGGEDAGLSFRTHQQLVKLHDDLERLFGVRLPIFIERFREDS